VIASVVLALLDGIIKGILLTSLTDYAVSTKTTSYGLVIAMPRDLKPKPSLACSRNASRKAPH